MYTFPGKGHEIEYRKLPHPPLRVKQPDSDYSYQMTRVSCLFNHLYTLHDNFFYFTSTAAGQYELRDAAAEQGLLHTFINTEQLLFNVSAECSPSDDRIFVCLGSGLHVLKYSEGVVEPVREQKLSHQSLLLLCYEREGATHLVTCHKAGDVFIHQILREAEDGQFAVIASIMLSGIAKYVSEKNDLLTIVSEGKVQAAAVLESPASEGVTAVLPAVKPPENIKNYTWTQSIDDVEVSIDLPSGILKTDLIVEIAHDHLEVITKGGQELFKSKLFSKVEAKESTWIMSSDKKKVEVHLEKYQTAHNWAHLIHSPGYDSSGNLLGEISDLSDEDLQTMMRRMQTLNEYTSDKVDNSPLYTPNKELDECDELDGQQVLVAGFDMSQSEMKQKYLVELSPGSMLFAQANHGFVVSHSVDACFYQTESLDNPWKHTGTFHAFNMVQATKTQKKFMVTDENMTYSAIIDISRHVYIYCSSYDSCTGKLLVMTLDNDDSEILGVFQKTDRIVLLTENNLISIKFTL